MRTGVFLVLAEVEEHGRGSAASGRPIAHVGAVSDRLVLLSQSSVSTAGGSGRLAET
jgi:hypothetical protein